MKVLIITTPLGQGHNSVAHAIFERFSDSGVDCLIMDMYEYIDPMLKEIVSKGFLLSMKSAAYVKGVASEIYDLNEKWNITSDFSISRFTNALLASELNDFLQVYQPDAIICTQVYAAQVINILKEKKALNALCIGIITDFTVQNYWEDVDHFEYIVVAHERLAFQLNARGIMEDRILPLGIPTHQKFRVVSNNEQLYDQLNLSRNTFTILIMGGGMGFGDISDYIEEIDASDLEVQMIVVCGKNKKLFDRLCEQKWDKKVVILGYVNDIPDLMDLADCFIGKPGGITTSELLIKSLPMIMIDPLPGVEDRNVEFLLNNGAAMLATKTFSLLEAITMLMGSPQLAEHLKDGMKNLAKPEATVQLADFVIETIKLRKDDKNDQTCFMSNERGE